MALRQPGRGVKKGQKLPRKSRSPRQLALVAGIVEGKSISEAGRDAGYASPQSAWDAYNRLKDEVIKALNKHNSPLDVAVKNMAEMCDATKIIFCQHEGKITDQREVADNETRLRANVHILRLLGAYDRPRKNRQEPDSAPVVQQAERIVIDVPLHREAVAAPGLGDRARLGVHGDAERAEPTGPVQVLPEPKAP